MTSKIPGATAFPVSQGPGRVDEQTRLDLFFGGKAAQGRFRLRQSEDRQGSEPCGQFGHQKRQRLVLEKFLPRLDLNLKVIAEESSPWVTRSATMRARLLSRSTTFSSQSLPEDRAPLPKPLLFQLGLYQRIQTLGGGIAQILAVEPGQLFQVEDGVALVDTLQGELVDQLLGGQASVSFLGDQPKSARKLQNGAAGSLDPDRWLRRWPRGAC